MASLFGLALAMWLFSDKQKKRDQMPIVHLYECVLCGARMTRGRRFYHIFYEHGMPKKRKFWRFFRRVGPA